jgi:hypothetical protein
VKVPSLRIVQMHGAGQARVKGMDGAEISTGSSIFATGVPISACSKDERCCLASRGEPFQVVGTTS